MENLLLDSKGYCKAGYARSTYFAECFSKMLIGKGGPLFEEAHFVAAPLPLFE